MKTYIDQLQYVLNNGTQTADRTGTGTLSTFGLQSRYNLANSFPAVTTKKLAWKACVGELLWMIEGSGDERRLAEITHGTADGKVTIWTPNAMSSYWRHKAKFEGDLGRVYGVQWRHWQTPKIVHHPELDASIVIMEEVDQLTNLIEGIKQDPHGRRHIMSAWNPGELDQMALPPCHILAQFYVTPFTQAEINTVYMQYRSRDDVNRMFLDPQFEGKIKTVEILRELGLPTGKLSCQMYQRSCDMFLGVPFNVASYSLLTHMIAQVCKLEANEFIHVLGDAHIYLNHVDQVKEQLHREVMPAPQLYLNPTITDITKFTMDDIRLEGYTSHGAIKADMAV
jgi:thymidylate synthase